MTTLPPRVGKTEAEGLQSERNVGEDVRDDEAKDAHEPSLELRLVPAGS